MANSYEPISNIHLSPGSDDTQVNKLLSSLTLKGIKELIDKAIPSHLQIDHPLNLPPPLSELELRKLVGAYCNTPFLAGENREARDLVSFLGAGMYDHFTPAIVDYLISLPGFLTAYTPYQAEVSQGTLQALFEFQSLLARLTNMELASAALYDGGSAIAEAALLALRVKKKNKLLITETLNPFYKQVLETYLKPHQTEIVRIPHKNGRIDKAKLQETIDDDTAAFIFQSPNFYGVIENPLDLHQIVGDALLIAVCEPISLALLLPPGDYNADIVVGEGQSLGWHLYFGGPALGYFAAKKKFARQLPGRLIGETVDVDNKRGFALILQTREQHIRRAEATSNVCTNETLVAIATAIYLSSLGEKGLKEVASLSMQKAHYLTKQLTSIDGVELCFTAPFFNEFVIKLPLPSRKLVERLCNEGYLAGYPIDEDSLLIAVTEKRTRMEMDNFVKAVRKAIE